MNNHRGIFPFLHQQRNKLNPHFYKITRELYGLSCSEIAAICRINTQSVKYWETGRTKPTPENKEIFLQYINKLETWISDKINDRGKSFQNALVSYDSIDLALPSHQRYFRFSRPFRHCIGQVCKHYDFKVTPIRFNLENYQEFLGDRLDSEAERQNWAEEIFNRSDVRVQNSSHLVKTENQKSSLESSSSSLKVSFA